MSWLFGKKKQKDSPPDSTEEEQPSDQGDEYVFVEGRSASLAPGLVRGNEAAYPNAGLYPFIGGVPTYPTFQPTDSSKQNNQGDVVHYLTDVPFKLCKQLEISLNDDFEIDNLRISEILSFLERLNSRNYEYDFSLEESVIAEMNSGNNE